MLAAMTNNMELVMTHTLSESWENNEKGNPIAIYNALIDSSDFESDDVLVFKVENNNAKSNRLDWMVTSAKTTVGMFLRSRSIYRNVVATNYCYVSIGATIKVYKFNISEI